MILKEFTKCGLNLQLINDGSNVNPLSIQLAGSQKSKKGYHADGWPSLSGSFYTHLKIN